MSESAIMDRWDADRPVYAAWGGFIIDQVREALNGRMDETQLESFLRIPPKCRLKASRSLVEKALYRGKPYTNPYEDITDKVGVRFVLLLTSDVNLVKDVVTQIETWTARKDKDFEDSRLAEPLSFSYQSVHYIVTNNSALEINDVAVPAGTACEVQIRTLLQHAHSELTHDTLYKSKTPSTPKEQRAAALSMALIEAADDYFERVVTEERAARKPITDALATVSQGYLRHIGVQPVCTSTTTLLIDSFADQLSDDLAVRLDQLFATKGYLPGKIATRRNEAQLFQQAGILVAYLVAERAPRIARQRWPLSPEQLRLIFDDVGQSFDG